MRLSIDAVLDLTKRYEAAARDKGFDELAETLARVRAAAGPVTYEDVQKMTEIDPEKGEEGGRSR